MSVRIIIVRRIFVYYNVSKRPYVSVTIFTEHNNNKNNNNINVIVDRTCSVPFRARASKSSNEWNELQQLSAHCSFELSVRRFRNCDSKTLPKINIHIYTRISQQYDRFRCHSFGCQSERAHARSKPMNKCCEISQCLKTRKYNISKTQIYKKSNKLSPIFITLY